MSKLPVAVQVYGLRDLLQDTPERFEEVMKGVKEIGYDGVELAGLYGLDPAYIKEVLDKIGLVPISAHVPFNELMDDLDKAIKDYKTLGVTYMVMPHIPEQYRPVNPEGFLNFLPKLQEMGEKIKAAGIDIDAFDALKLAEEAGSSRAVNLVLMGRLSRYFSFPEEEWLRTIEKSVPEKFLEMNKKAFILGKNS